MRDLQLRAGASDDHTCLMATAGLLVAYYFSALAGPNPSNLLDLECKLKHAAYLYSNIIDISFQHAKLTALSCSRSLLACAHQLIFGLSWSEQVRVVDGETTATAEPAA